MIAMWDDCFQAMDETVDKQLIEGSPSVAFEKMHVQLDKVWNGCASALKPGGFICVNIGDATRSTEKNGFSLFSNHARITKALCDLGLIQLPDILWRKPSNAPNKFMGSGMLPAGAYVTYEHEYILIFRKEGKREFSSAEEKRQRQESAFFWEERNVWFSDLWQNIKGTKQTGKKIVLERDRSAAFPMEVPYRLINMYSLIGDVVLDPFAGTGTTSLAAMASARNSIGTDIDKKAFSTFASLLTDGIDDANSRVISRLEEHSLFISQREQAGKTVKHTNHDLKQKVMTAQEVNLRLMTVESTCLQNNAVTATHQLLSPENALRLT
jgi:DNA modification methylase